MPIIAVESSRSIGLEKSESRFQFRAIIRTYIVQNEILRGFGRYFLRELDLIKRRLTAWGLQL
jgi:hypothetical protein